MNPDDRILIGVINRKTDLNHLLNDAWYRIPVERMPKGIEAEYIGFFLSGSANTQFNNVSGIYYYAPIRGISKVKRKDLLPDETSQKAQRSSEKMYYRVDFERDLIQLLDKSITNENSRVVVFIKTTMNIFLEAETIADLYTKKDEQIDRIEQSVRKMAKDVQRTWDVDYLALKQGASLQVACEKGDLTIMPDDGDHRARDDGDIYYFKEDDEDDEIVREIRRRINALDGPKTWPLGMTY